MANPPVPNKWKDEKVVPPAAKSREQIEDLAELAKASQNVPAARLVKMLKIEYNNWLDFTAKGDKSGAGRVAPKVVAMFNAAVDSIMSKAGGGSGELPCGSPFGNPCEAQDNVDKINLDVLAQKIYQRLIVEARIERERYGWNI